MKKTLFLIFFIGIFQVHAQILISDEGIVNTCSDSFFDSGASSLFPGNYDNNENYEITLCPDTPGTYIQLDFLYLDIESFFDTLTFYEGTGTGGTLIGTFNDLNGIQSCNGTFMASSHSSGCITIVFNSDGSVNYSGWEAIISCVTTPGGELVAGTVPENSVCGGSGAFCADAGILEFPNISDSDCVPDSPNVVVNNSCLGSAPNPAWYFVEIGVSGLINIDIEQTTGPGGTGTGLDVDFVVWGPYPDSASACVDFTTGDCTSDHNCSGTVIDCSYSTNSIETATIPNAIVGEFYMFLVTNYNGNSGYITLTQTNQGNPGAGSTDCCPFITVTDSTSCNSSDGQIDISLLLPNTAYTVTYNDPAPQSVNITSNALGIAQITGLSAGTYTNIDTGTLGCLPQDVILNTNCSCILTLDTVGTNTQTVCINENITDIIYTVGGNATGANVSGLPPGVTVTFFGGVFTISGTPSTTVGSPFNYTITTLGCVPNLSLTGTITVNSQVTPMFTQVADICSGDTLNALPLVSDNGVNGTWNPALDNNTTTTYTFTPDAGECATTQTMTITVNPQVTPMFTQMADICSGDTLNVLPLVSDNGVNGTWNPALDNTTTTTYTFTPDAGECATTQTMTITVNPQITPIFTQVAAICSGDTLNALPLVSDNGVNGTWNPALDNTTTTTYTFTPDAGECATTQTMTITVNPQVTPMFTQMADICSGDTLNVLPLVSDNGVNGTWNPALDNTTTTTYTFTPDAGECATTQTMTITVNPQITPIFTQVAAICSGDTLNALPLVSDNGVNGTWNPALDNTTTTTYTFTPDAGECATIQTMTIGVNSLPIVNILTSQDFTCSNSVTSFTLFVTGSTLTNGTWTGIGVTDNGDGTANFDPALAAGTPGTITTVIFTYTVTDPTTNCTNSASSPFSVATPPDILVGGPYGPYCESDSPITLTAGNMPINFPGSVEETGTWTGTGVTDTSDIDNVAIFDPSIAGTGTHIITYQFVSFHGIGYCVNSDTITITVNSQSTPTFTQVADICSGDTLNALPLVSDNGINGTWNPALDNTTTTTYTFTPDAGECATTQTMTITVNSQITPMFTQVADICSGETLNALPLVSDNGVNGTWNPALDNTTTTTYTFTPDAGECATTQTMTITVNSQVTPMFTQVADICSGETINALPLVSDNGVNGTWNPALDNTTTTTYTFTPNAGECATTQTMTITVNSQVTPMFTQVADICSGDTLNALPLVSDNGINGTWNPALDNTTTTTYTFTPDAGECATTQTMTITVNPQIIPMFTQVAAICSGDTLNALPLVSDNGINGTWNPTLDNTTTTPYTFTPDAGECATTQTMTITVNSQVTPMFTQVAAICSGDTLNALPLVSDNGINGTWNPALDNTTTTPYTFTPDAGECATTQTMTIIVNPQITPMFTQVADICSGDTLNALPLVSDNGINGTWNPALDNTTTTPYTFTPDAGECATTQTMTITVNSQVTPMFTQVAAICSGDTLNALPLVSDNGVNGTWNPALDNTTTTPYTFTPDAGECATTQTMTITVNPQITPMFTQVADICSGDTLNALPLVSDNGVNGTWNPALDNNTTTTYTFTPDAGECATTQTMTITVNSQVTPMFTQVADICSGETLNALPLVSDNGVNGTWNPALDNNTTTTYTFTPDAGECATTQTMTITVNSQVTPMFTQVADICSGETLNALPLVSDNGVNGTWNPALDNTTTTTYTFTPNAGECATTQTMTITVNSQVTPMFTQVAAICSGDTLNALPLVSDNGINGTWNPALDNTTTTPYTFTPNAGECATTQTMTIIVNPQITPMFTQVADICSGDTLNALPLVSDNGINGTWNPTLDNTTTTPYTFTPDAGECATTQTMTITVNDCLLTLKYPLFFTPNDDGYNDTWNISDLNSQPDATIYIFDRYGKLLKQLNPTGSGWNGTLNGHPLPTSDYWFFVEYRDLNDLISKKQLKAHFTLKR